MKTQLHKEQLRTQLRAELARLQGSAEKAALARELLLRQRAWKEAKSVLLYAPIKGELDVWPLLETGLKTGKRMYLPRYIQAKHEKPLKRFERERSDGNTLLKQGVNEKGFAEAVREGSKNDGEDDTREAAQHDGGQYVACEIKEPEKELVSGRFGIREPGETCVEMALNRLDLVLVPGVAFDLHGRRLGRGKGFYDRMLAAVVSGKTCGVAFDEQVVSEVPMEPHDTRLSCILTPTRWIEL